MGEALDYLETVEEVYEPNYDYECDIELEDYISALEEANYNIQEVNNNIENARGYAWEDYQSMEEALDYLEEVETVSIP